MGLCEALEGVERAAAHPATSWQTVGEGEAAGGRESPHGAGLLYDARREAYMNVFRRYYDTNSVKLVLREHVRHDSRSRRLATRR